MTLDQVIAALISGTGYATNGRYCIFANDPGIIRFLMRDSSGEYSQSFKGRMPINLWVLVLD